MLVCIPSLDDGSLDAPVSQHFGRAPGYTIYDTEADAAEAIDNDSDHNGGRRSPPQFIAQTGADVLLTGNLGRKAIERFDQMDIDVYCGAEGTVREAIDQFDAGALDEATPASGCSGHDHDDGHGHGHGDGHDGGHGHSHDHGEGHGHDHGDGPETSTE
ncbi:NifB/NifX family molybdenum-iron cluster-binding protein [Halorhabdus salina]|uniref:NifB/NifX family molybdenum-iron cluster-binding protein n=1 Tax=Halorhabdus salina TaxID=2750670 RepID=UPI0015EF4163|nr:NifB/NifX family molybdenum-iron cluster-binding protein [Halorhabdus salina]